MNPVDSYIRHIESVRRFSQRTVSIYSDVLARYCSFYEVQPSEIATVLTPQRIRNYELYLLDDCSESASTVNLHLSTLSGFSRFLIRKGLLDTNPVRMVSRPKEPKRLPLFYKENDMSDYFFQTQSDASADSLDLLLALPAGDKTALQMYERRLGRMIISLLYSTGLRRAELISLTDKSVDFSRKVLHVVGKGNKPREIPLTGNICSELQLYVRARNALFPAADHLLLTSTGRALYPMFLDRTVKRELSMEPNITVRRSPHVLRHTLATELLDNGADLNSIKELLGHSSLAATQVYTHNSVERLKKVYAEAHPRAKKEE